MVYSGHSLDGGADSPPAVGWAGVDTTTLREVAVEPGYARPALLDHHLLFLVTVGHGTHEVDFRNHNCRPGTLIWARPGQVIRYGGQGGLDAIIVRWDAGALTDLDGAGPHAADPTGPGYWQLAGEDEDAVINEVSQLVVDCQRHGSGGRAAELLRHQLTVLLLRLALLPEGGTTSTGTRTPTAVADPAGTRTVAAPDTFQRLRREVELSYGRSRRVEDYADRLDCSVRTLTRACLAVTGRTAKQVIDDRVALEAMRLLAATDTPIADIGRRLGFSEPTNFGRFFQREVGQSPGTFRAATVAGSRAARPDRLRSGGGRLPEQRVSVLTASPPPGRTGR